MKIAGWQKLTLIDFPGKIATTIFTVGCNFRCPFCHNPELVKPGVHYAKQDIEERFFDFLKKRKGKLDGVCITGGEPTLQSDILEFIKKIKEIGYSVKLDTNGTRPDIIRKALAENLVDFIAMDIKNQMKKYPRTSGSKMDLDRIKLSVKLIMNSRLPYEFRTTAVPGIHTENDFLEIAKWIKGARAYWIQRYQEIKILNPDLKEKTKGKKIDLEKIKKKINPYFQTVGIRG